MKQDIDELAKSINLPHEKTKDLIERIKNGILLSLYRFDPVVEGDAEKTEYNYSINKKIESIYEKKHVRKFNPKVLSKNHISPMFLFGPPGHGKTASYLVACKEICEELGFRMVQEPDISYVPRKDDFLVVLHPTDGENSSITFGGIPKTEEVEINGVKRSVLKKALNFKFTLFGDVAGGLLLFDDAANATKVVQNALLPVAQFGTFQDLKLPNTYVGFTGNLGALDGTYTTDPSSALMSRVVPVFVTDNAKDFVNRAYSYYNDELGDLGIINFITRNPKDFAHLPSGTAKHEGFPCPRNWDYLMQEIRTEVEMNGGRGVGEERSLPTIRSLCVSKVGPEVGHKLVSYFNSLIMGADPLARKFIATAPTSENKGEMDELLKELKKKYGNGASSEDISFGYQFATACGDYAVNHIVASQDPEKALVDGMKRFGNAVLALNDSEFSFALEHMKNKLAAYVTKFAQPTRTGTKELTPEVRIKIAETINDLPDCGSSKRDILIKVITDMDKITNNANVLGGRRKRIE